MEHTWIISHHLTLCQNLKSVSTFRPFYESLTPQSVLFLSPPSFVLFYLSECMSMFGSCSVVLKNSLIARVIKSPYEGFHCFIDCSNSLHGNIIRLPD